MLRHSTRRSVSICRPTVGQAVEALVALGLFTPFADEKALRFQPPQQRIERAFVDDEPVFREQLAQRVSVLLGAERREHGDGQAAAAELRAGGCRRGPYQSVYRAPYTVCHTLYATQ